MSGPCALLVEAAGDPRGRLVGLLESEGFRVDLAEDGRSALQRLQRRPRPALIVITLTGAQGDVLGMAGMICKDPTLQDVPVVAVIAEDAREEPGAGFTAKLTRPVSPEALSACLDEFSSGAGPDPLEAIRENLRDLIRADGSTDVSLAESLTTLARLAESRHPEETPQPGARDSHKP